MLFLKIIIQIIEIYILLNMIMELKEKKWRMSIHVFLIHKRITTMYGLYSFMVMHIGSFETMHIHHCNGEVSLAKSFMLAEMTCTKTTGFLCDSSSYQHYHDMGFFWNFLKPISEITYEKFRGEFYMKFHQTLQAKFYSKYLAYAFMSTFICSDSG